jgi:LysR family transcriptional regulator, glycine cleavage system transcriptional activator
MSKARVRKSEPSIAFDRLPLNALRVFEAVATELSFTTAAEALHVTPAAVSMQIKTLEEYLRVPLFRRSGRAVALTPEGVQLLPGVRRGLEDLQQAMKQLRQSRAGGPLNITTIASFLQKWLLPRLPRFQEQHPEIDLRIHTSRRTVDFSQTDFQCAIRMALGPTPGLYSEKLLDEWFVAVCSVELLKKFGPVNSSEDLERYPLLRSSDEPWELWTRPRGVRDWKEHGTAYDDSVTVLTAAEQGQGLALTRWCLVARDLEAGRVVRASATIVPCPRSYYFVCPDAYLSMPKVKQWLAWLREVARAFPGPDTATISSEPRVPSRTVRGLRGSKTLRR